MVDEEYPIAKFVRLQNGDDLICQLVELEEDEYSLYLIMKFINILMLLTMASY